MKIQCLNKNLKSAVSIAERNVSKNQTLPILGSVFLDAEKDRIKIKATNLETAIEIVLSGKIHESGSVVIPAKTLSMFLSNISDDQITLQSQKNNLFVKTNNIETLIRGYPLDDFPIFPKIDTLEIFNIPSPELKNGISSVAIATSTSDIKPELSSIFFNIFKNTIKIAATDSFRLAEKTIVSKNLRTDKSISFLIPQQGAQEILKLLDEDEDIGIGVNKNQIVLSSGNYKFISRLTDGKFPDYEQILPKTFKTTAVVKKSDILSNIKLASVFVGKLNDVTLVFNPNKNAIFINISHSDIGEHSANINASIQGDSVAIKFNWKYLLDGISQINSEYVEFNLNNDQSPMLIKGKGDASYIYLAMPMRGA